MLMDGYMDLMLLLWWIRIHTGSRRAYVPGSKATNHGRISVFAEGITFGRGNTVTSLRRYVVIAIFLGLVVDNKTMKWACLD